MRVTHTTLSQEELSHWFMSAVRIAWHLTSFYMVLLGINPQ